MLCSIASYKIFYGTTWRVEILSLLFVPPAKGGGMEIFMTDETFGALEEKIGYRFRDKTLLRRALTHSSYANEMKINKYKDYERLEFLGDAVLELVSLRNCALPWSASRRLLTVQGNFPWNSLFCLARARRQPGEGPVIPLFPM